MVRLPRPKQESRPESNGCSRCPKAAPHGKIRSRTSCGGTACTAKTQVARHAPLNQAN